jgi:hypothetical protein
LYRKVQTLFRCDHLSLNRLLGSTFDLALKKPAELNCIDLKKDSLPKVIPLFYELVIEISFDSSKELDQYDPFLFPLYSY